MKLEKAEELAKELINKYLIGYEFKFDLAKKRFGYCNLTRKIISISKYLTAINPEIEVQNTILHEIAHAITLEGHTKRFYQKCKEIGCPSKRTINVTNSVEGKYLYECRNCGKIHNFHKRIKRAYSCGFCSKTFNNKYLLILKEN